MSARVSTRLAPFGTSIFAEMTSLANEHGAINLSQGFPDFEGPPGIVDAAVRALQAGHNQYARSLGVPTLALAVAAHQKKHYGLEVEPLRGVLVTCGATEAIAVALLGLLEPGDEVVLFEPFYDSYPAVVTLAGAVPRFVTLRFPAFALDEDALRAQLSDKTRMIVLNTPHNPTGKVFTRAELDVIARVAQERDLLVLSDEVYEHLTYGEAEHVPLATLPGMFERTLTASSTGKTFSFTGWKVGWLSGPPTLIAAAQAAHQFTTFAGATPLQVAMGEALTRYSDDFFRELRLAYSERRDFLVATLRESGFDVAVPDGTYFVLADFRRVFDRGDDRAFARYLIERAGVAAIPPSPFYAAALDEGRRLVRFAFCKRMDTLRAAAEGFSKLGSA